MNKIQDKDTRYFIEIDLATLKVIKCAYAQKEDLDKGRQTNSAVHRLFVTEGQFKKMLDRCGKELESVVEK